VSDALNKGTVLVLVRNWQGIGTRSSQYAFCQMATGVAAGLKVAGEDFIRPPAA
jgi:hypothetical protein